MSPAPVALDPLGLALAAATKGEFSILGTLGRGGMAAVYLAKDRGLDRLVAIKVLLPELLAANPAAADRFVLEARTAAGLAHPHIVPIYTVRQSETLHWFAMGFVDGWPLDAMLRDRGPLPAMAVRIILAEAASALAFAHRKGIVHRDLKPGNIMIDTEGRAVVLDFGIAKVADQHGLTQTGTAIGTPTYMSPEQCRGHDATSASDQYALGAVAYELLVGEPVFKSENTFGLIYQHVHEPPRSLFERVAGCPSELASGIMRMLAKDPSERWASLAALSEALGSPRASDAAVLRDFIQRETPNTRLHPAAPASAVAPMPSPRVPSVPVSVPPPVPTASTAVLELAAMMSPGLVAVPKSTAGVLTPEPIAAAPTMPVPLADSDTQTQELSLTDVRLELAPRRSTLTIGQSFALTSLLARPLPAEYPVEWVSEDPSVVRVTPDGQAIAEQVGSTTVLVRDLNGEARAKLDVTRVAVARVRLSSPSPSLSVGDAMTIVATVHDRLNSPLEHRFLEWRSTDSRVASITPTGVLTGRSPGKVTIIVTCAGVTAEIDLVVGPERLTGVMVLPRSLALVAGESATLQALPLTARGQSRTPRPVSWGTTNPNVAQVFDDGRVLAVGKGLARISASIEGWRGYVPVEVRRSDDR